MYCAIKGIKFWGEEYDFVPQRCYQCQYHDCLADGSIAQPALVRAADSAQEKARRLWLLKPEQTTFFYGRQCHVWP